MLLPGRSGAAQASVAQPIDNSQGDFADGDFQRTSIGPNKIGITATSPDPQDVEGVVQLAPAGVLNKWDSIATPLPVAVADASVTAIGKRIYVIGGTVSGSNGFTDAAYWATVEPTTGSLVDLGSGPWTNNPMPGALVITDSTAAPGCKVPTSQRTRAGVASVATGTDVGYIYMVGGAVNPASCVVGGASTPLVQRGTVAANGTITWATLSNAYLPSPKTPDDGIPANVSGRTLGVEGASVVIAHTKGSTGTEHYYLYVIGGKSRYVDLLDTTTTKTRVISSVFYTEINIADGSLKNPTNGSPSSVWQRDKNINLISTLLTDEGLWDATATAASVEVGTTLKSAIFLSGGSLDADTGAPNPTKLNPYVYRADVDKDTGALTWASGTNTVGSTTVGLAARRGMASVSYNNKLYMIGGRIADGADTSVDTVPTAFFDDNLNVLKIDATDYFVGTADGVLNAGGPGYRSSLGAAVVRAEPPTGTVVGTLNSAWVFVMGGNDRTGALQSTIFLGKIGGDEAANTIRAPDGWYYSGVIKTSFEFGSGANVQNKQARVLAMHWAADIDRVANPNADIQLEFRKTITASGECPDDKVFTSSADDRWRGPIDGFTSNTTLYSQAATSSSNLYNTVQMADIFGTEQLNASCIQYRAHLMQNATGGAVSSPSATPKLLSVYIEKVIVGNADINIPTNGLSVTTTASNRISSFVMNVQNLSDKGLGETLSVEEARVAGGIAADGSFYVFLCMAYSAPKTAMPSLTLPDPNNLPTGYATTCPASAIILTREMQKGTVLDLRQAKNIVGNPRWYSTTTDQPISDILSLFATEGNYRVGLILDPLNYVPEGTVGEANNRGETAAAPSGQTVAFTVAGPPVTIVSLPFVRR